MTGRMTFEERDGWTIAVATGEIDSSNTPDIRVALATRTPNGRLVLDLSRVTYIDSSGLALVDGLRRALELRVVAPPGSVSRRLLEIAGLDQLVPIADRL